LTGQDESWESTTVAKFLRIWEKKRGARRTGSKLLGSLGEAVFFGVLFLLGVVLSALFFSVESPGDEGFWVKVMVLASFILIGGSGLVLTVLDFGVSPERRSAIRRKAADIDLIKEAMPSSREYPNVPPDANLTNSPGIVLAYRLPASQSPAWRLLAASMFFVVWVVITGILLFVALQRLGLDATGLAHTENPSDWLLNLSLIPFFSVAVWSGRYLWRQVRIHMGIGPTNVEVSDHPLRLGENYQIFLSQAGRLKVQSLEVILLCEEQATYRHGTDVRTETHPVYRQQLIRHEQFQIESGLPFEQELDLPIPSNAMHSFQGSHNAIHWKLVVRGDVETFPPFERSFPLVVLPSAETLSRTPVVSGEVLSGSSH